VTPLPTPDARPAARPANAVAAPQVLTIRLSVSNAYLIQGPRPVLVDTGSKTDLAVLGRGLAAQGITAGSLVLQWHDGRVFAGDRPMGGRLGGALFPHRASLPYFAADRAAHRASLRALPALPVHTLYLGHGGPLSRAAVIEAFGADIATA